MCLWCLSGMAKTSGQLSSGDRSPVFPAPLGAARFCGCSLGPTRSVEVQLSPSSLSQVPSSWAGWA